ncbi:MAG: anion permease, partial [Planctomycetota bacterium]
MSNASQEPHHLPRLLVCIAVGAALWWSPTPVGLTDPAWHIFAVFAATIVSFLLRPLPMGVCVLVSLLTLTLTQDFYGATPEGMAESEASRLGESANDAELAEATVDRQPLKRSFEQSLSGFANTT